MSLDWLATYVSDLYLYNCPCEAHKMARALCNAHGFQLTLVYYTMPLPV